MSHAWPRCLPGCRRRFRRDAQPSLRLGMDAVGTAFRAIACGELELAIAGGVESMSRAPM